MKGKKGRIENLFNNGAPYLPTILSESSIYIIVTICCDLSPAHLTPKTAYCHFIGQVVSNTVSRELSWLFCYGCLVVRIVHTFTFEMA